MSKSHSTRSLIVAAVLVSGVLVAAPFAFAHGHMHGGNGEFGMLGHLQKAKQALGLSDQQVSDIESILKSVREQNAPYRESKRSGMQSVFQTLIKNPNDTAAAQAIIDQQITAERAVKANMLAATSKALNVLTADQRAKLSTLVEERIARRQSK